jgi:hydroxyethylthiazole kinase-like uncharacterized protein yjeF
MQKVLTAEQMREVDRLTTERYGIPSILLMENAAHAVARVITEKLGGSVEGKSILILCGKGNNGGDGAALARILVDQDAYVCAVLIGRLDESRGDAKRQFEILDNLEQKHAGMTLDFWQIPDYAEFSQTFEHVTFDLFVDALFGTGLTRKLGDPFDEILMLIAERSTSVIPWLALDLPSGLNADLSEPIGPFQSAQTTVTFTAPKVANVLPPASGFGGDLVVAKIGSPLELIDEQPSLLYFGDRFDAVNWLGKSSFTNSSYKNKRGHVLVIAGSESYSGAAVLAGDAAMRSGVGLVTVVTPKSSKDSVAARVLPELMVRGVAETESGAISELAYKEIKDLIEKADSVAIGSGISHDESTQKFVQKTIEARRQPTVVDADALNLLSPFAGFAANGESQFPLILTPHEGEFMKLLGTDDKETIKDRVAAVREFAINNNVILVLKGERVLIGEPGGKVVVNPTGNSGLGKAGNGDTLTGILAGFVAQAAAMKIDIFETVVAAVYVAGKAGDVAEKKYGKRVMTASDVRECLRETFQALAVSDKA